MSFARRVTVIEAALEDVAVREQTLRSSPAISEPAPMDIQLHEPVCTLPPEEDSMDASHVVVKPDVSSGFEKFTWPEIPRGPCAAVREQTLRSSPAISEPAPMDIRLARDFPGDQVAFLRRLTCAQTCPDGFRWGSLVV